MSLFNRLLGRDTSPKPRTRICIECGMPPASHKEWCAIFRAETEMKTKGEEKDPNPSPYR
jgi:hypothetical protein